MTNTKAGPTLPFTVTLALTFAAGSLPAAEVKLPSTLAWSAYDVGSSGYTQSVAIGNVLKSKHGVNLRVLPGKNDTSRNLALRNGQAQFAANDIGGTYLAQEGVHDFGAKAWGPQPVRALLLNNGDALLTLIAAKDANIKTMADLRGKRVAWVIGSPSLNRNVTALLAFAGLGWNDVEKVEFDEFSTSIDGIINNQVDAAFGSSMSGKAYQLDKSPRGLAYPTIPRADEAGWKRLKAVAPFFVPSMGTEGAALAKDNPVEAATYPYPILIAYENQDADLVYNMTKAMVENYKDYKNGAPGNNGWALDRQIFEWVVPWHEGAIKYFKEVGVWRPSHQAHNDKLLSRQKVLAEAWANVRKHKYADKTAFVKVWMKVRADTLKKAGMEPVVTEWKL